MSDKLIIILLIDFLISLILLKLVFGSYKEVKKCLYYLVKPDIVSIVNKDYDNDFNYTYKFLFVTILLVIIGFIEFYFFLQLVLTHIVT